MSGGECAAEETADDTCCRADAISPPPCRWPAPPRCSAARRLADEGPPETTTIRLPMSANICWAPQYVAEELLRAEGFTDVRYVPATERLS